jgi:hypothetical protein
MERCHGKKLGKKKEKLEKMEKIEKMEKMEKMKSLLGFMEILWRFYGDQ